MPHGNVMAKGLVQRIGESRSEAAQTTDKGEISVERQVKDHKQGLEVAAEMLTDPAKGALGSLAEIGACGHRVVHGGEAFTGSVLVDEKVEKTIKEFADLAPLHNPPNLTGIKVAKALMGDIPQVACFDTAFHHSIPPVAYLYALPYEMYEKYKVRRYGFHGTSHRYVARRAAVLMGKEKYDVSLVTCHLGNGCSVTAVKNGKSIDTSMGLTPLEGLVMGTRSGDIDPAIVFHLTRKGYEVQDLDAIFNKKSGLLGISGSSNDMRDLEAKAEQGDKRALLALDIFAYRMKKYIGAYCAVLNRIDGIVFTGGIGENGAQMRWRILKGLDIIGISVDAEKNALTVGMEGEIQTKDSKVRIFVIPTDEEAAIAHDTFSIAKEERV